MSKHRGGGWLSVFICILLLMSVGAWSQTITITSPTSNVELKDGDEFSCTVPGVPWDMDQVRDIGYDINFQQPTVSDGIWRGTNLSEGAAFYPLYKGYSVPTYTNYPSYYTDGMPYGPLNPIDCSTYDQISIRLGLPQSARSSFWLAWTTSPNTTEDAVNGPYLGFQDGDYLFDGNYEAYADGFRIYDLGFTSDAFFRERVSSYNIQPSFTTAGSWSGTNYGFFFEPTLSGAVGTQYEVDWIRLYNSGASPTLSITWSTTGISTNYNPSSIDHRYSIQLWVDTDNSGYDGDLFMTGLINDGRYDLYTAALPPGDYYVYLKAVYRGSSSYSTLATSSYSGRIRILAAPSIEFTAPSYTSGTDYAATDLGNAWDMSDSSDIDFTLSTNISSYGFAGGLFYAYANPPLAGQTESDAQLMLNTKVSGVYVPIDATRYRYLTYRMGVEPAGYTNINDRVARGWVARFIWGKTLLEVDGTQAQGIPILEDWHSYTLDLWDSGLLETTYAGSPPQVGWKPSGTVNWLRFDPLEVPQYTMFYIEDIKLCSENVPVNNSYTISWVVSDADSSEVTIALSYGTLSGTNFSGTAITTVTQAPGSGSYEWNTSGVADGDYYIQATVSDGSNTVSRCSRVPVVVGGSSTSPTQFMSGEPAVGDYDGDGISDVTVYKESTGYWVIQLSGAGSVSSTKWGASGYKPAPKDFDNDGKDDLTVYCDSGDWPGYWYILRSTDYTMSYAKWGTTDYIPVPADYDGDGTADLAVYCTADDWPGYWYILKSTDYTMSYAKFGASGYTPVPADYDGDGTPDLAVYCEIAEYEGYWYILNSSDYSMSYMKFGAIGYTAVPADYDGDGKADIAVYCESADMPGYWFIWLSGSSSMYYCPFGATGYVAAPGDYDGDGVADLAVYSSTTGNWYAMSLAGSVLVWIE